MSASPRYKSEDHDATTLASPLHFNFANVDAPNRFLKAAMTERSSTWDPVIPENRGVPGAAMFQLYKTWGEGRIGLILTGNVMLEYDQVATAGDLVAPRGAPFSGPRFEAFQKLAAAGKAQGSLMVAQLNHPGKQIDSRIQPYPVSASESPAHSTLLGFEAAKARSASTGDIARIVDGFAHSAEYLDKAGFDGVEFHAAHGYLIAQFLSADTNLRTDQYGQSLENRARLLVEVAQAIRKRTRPSFILGVKLNSVEFQHAGLRPEEAKRLCEILEESQFDFVELSGGTLEHFVHKRESTRKREGFFMEFADSIVPMLTKTKVYVTGGFKTIGGMAKAVERVDGVGLGRPLAQEPWLVKELLAGEINGAILQRQDESDYGLTNMVAGSQLRRLGAGQQPLDMSRQENEEAFGKAVGKWLEEAKSDAVNPVYGYPDITNVT
ncbi:hypothetical protein M409DRAFT_24273 [Zasmidium cellare ATCC 36951]|uniref:NADH:flavin oxidoreductase/NADH oxidase N-terminal domain-containing protein n=1 Tax=Zasmidium cellare ATCC 36951 TaxID=1080233 RepID=A0A6A6CFK1_ZASCE|nr:uncharacterized protein M409DRAFT_24273 [Zasmidium cellare ATCC 36951]KAF2165423.1 hypothetical protein M409DRAFT_24273 [Zasmidium cellare ATCC 36951]